MINRRLLAVVVFVPVAVDFLLCLGTLKSVHGMHEYVLSSVFTCDICKAIILRYCLSMLMHAAALLALLYFILKKISEIDNRMRQLKVTVASIKAKLLGAPVVAGDKKNKQPGQTGHSAIPQTNIGQAGLSGNSCKQYTCPINNN